MCYPCPRTVLLPFSPDHTTHFANTPTKVIELTLEGLAEPDQLAVLRAVFHEPDRLRPEKTIQAITEEAAGKVTTIAQALRTRGLPPERVARFLDRVVFCLFAEDVQLLPNKIFTRMVQNTQGKPDRFRALAADLFGQMAGGGDFGADRIEHFNGNLFDTVEALELTVEELRQLIDVSLLDWSNIDASIFGTLFERALDPDKRSQLGAHYTSREDIETLIEPVVMLPLRREWVAIRERFDTLIAGKPTPKKWKDARRLMRGFLDRLAAVTVLDPACGSGNFLYVTLQKLKDLEKEAIIHSAAHFSFFPQVGPWQLRGIEVNTYAHDLAQMTGWIGHLQWHDRHGMPLEERPILRPMANFELKDAILRLGDHAGSEPLWPNAEFIVSNPPFLGGKKMRDQLGNEYVEALFEAWDGRVPAEADYCCYWFEKARAQVEAGKARRVGLLATQSIRQGASRVVLSRIKETGNIFFAESDRPWVLDGASVRVSMVGFDAGEESHRQLDGQDVSEILVTLSAGVNVAAAKQIPENADRAFVGTSPHGPFAIGLDQAVTLLAAPLNPNGLPNSDVLRPSRGAEDVVRRPKDIFTIFFNPDLPRDQAALYEQPFEQISRVVRPVRSLNHRRLYRERWWVHGEPRPGLVRNVLKLRRYIATPRVAKHRLFVWLQPHELPSDRLIAIASDDDAMFGVLHSRVHEVWSLNTVSWHGVGNDPTYNAESCFETFPFLKMNDASRQRVADAARELDLLRQRWLNPSEWTRNEEIAFPASIQGPWAHLVSTSNASAIGTAVYRRSVPVDDRAKALLRKRTLTNLYNERPTWLQDAHCALDEAVFTAYGWESTLTDEEVLGRLLTLNRRYFTP